MIIGIDAGNTSTVLAALEGGRVLAKERIATPLLLEDSSAVLPVLNTVRNSAKRCLVGSVVDELNDSLRDALTGCGLETAFLGIDVPVPVGNKARYPEKVGVDRLLNCLAVKALGKAPAVVVDFGTGTNFDVVGEDGSFEGGIISPDIEGGISYLAEHASKLPTIAFKKPGALIGTDTVGAMTSGIFYSALGGVEKILTLLQEELPRSFALIATGGKARILLESLPFAIEEVPDLTLMGIAHCAKD